MIYRCVKNKQNQTFELYIDDLMQDCIIFVASMWDTTVLHQDTII